MKYKANTILTK